MSPPHMRRIGHEICSLTEEYWIVCSLAYAQLYLTFAHLFRNFDLSLHETTVRDIEWDDCFTPKTKGHLKVMVREAAD